MTRSWTGLLTHTNFETVEEFLVADVVSCPKLVKKGRKSKKYNQSKESGHLLQGSGNTYCVFVAIRLRVCVCVHECMCTRVLLRVGSLR